MGIKLKHNVFLGEKRGTSTPTTSWKIGLAHSDGSLVHVQNSNFPNIDTLSASARKLGANLKKTQIHIKAINMNKGDSGVGHCNHEKEECLELHSHIAEPPDDTQEQPASASSLRRHIAATLFQHHRFVGINGHPLQPVSLASPNSSPEPLFPGENAVDQLVEIIKVLGTPTREKIRCMNPNYTDFRFPQIKAHPWHKVFHKSMPPEAIDLASRLLQYSPSLRCTALEACSHCFFDDLRDPRAHLPNGRPLPPLFNFKQELDGASPELINRLIPEHIRRQSGLSVQQSAAT